MFRLSGVRGLQLQQVARLPERPRGQATLCIALKRRRSFARETSAPLEWMRCKFSGSNRCHYFALQCKYFSAIIVQIPAPQVHDCPICMPLLGILYEDRSAPASGGSASAACGGGGGGGGGSASADRSVTIAKLCIRSLLTKTPFMVRPRGCPLQPFYTRPQLFWDTQR